MKKSLLNTLVFLFIFQFQSWSQQYFFKNISIEQGLPQSSAYSIIQDAREYIWIGTDGSGVCRFDGKEFKTFNKTNGLSGNVVRSLFEDSKGIIWIGTDKGLNTYDGLKFAQVGESNGISGTSILSVAEDTAGIIWVGTNDRGLFRIERADSMHVVNISMKDGLVSNFIFDIQPDKYGRLWLAMIGGINVVEIINDKPEITKFIKDSDIPSDFVICAEMDLNGDIWFGTYGNGVFKIKVESDLKNLSIKDIGPLSNSIAWDIKCFDNDVCWIATDQHGVFKLVNGMVEDHFSKENGLQSNQVVKLSMDKEGNMWFATLGSGLLMFENKRFISYNSSNNLKSNQIFTILEENNRNIYTGTDEGLFKYEKDKDKLLLKSHFNTSNGLKDNNVNALAKNGDLTWIGTNNGMNVLKNGVLSGFQSENEFTSKKVTCLLVDKRNNLWVGTDNGFNKVTGTHVYSMNEDNGLVNNEIQTIIEDSHRNIWMGTLGGLVKLQDTLYSDYIEEDGLQELSIHSLTEDKKGNIWIGTFGGGIFRFDVSKDSVPISLVASKGILSSNNIYSLEFRSDTVLVAGIDNGFDEISLDKDLNIKKVVFYGVNDGFRGGKNNINSLVANINGLCWFGTTEGLIRYNSNISNKRDFIPKTIITGVHLFFEDVDWSLRGEVEKWFNLPVNLVLPHDENHLTFKFSGIFFQDPQGLKYSYFLEGQSKDWSPYSSVNEFTFPGLAPGVYKFLVKTINKYGVEGETAQFAFTIKPPFWMTLWFLISSVLLLSFTIYSGIRLRLRKLRMEKLSLEKIVVERTREVVMQKNEIEKQRDVVIWQKQEITDSINYARKIQSAVLPDREIIKDFFKDYFIIFKPKAIVSGDFYWINKKNDRLIFIASDCTGHGVPGAFMSMLGVSFLNEIVNQAGILEPDIILNRLRTNILSAFRQHKVSEQETKDGMDISVCSYDIKNNKLYFSGANNPLYLIRKVDGQSQLFETPGDKMPVAYYSNMEDFTKHEIDILAGDTVYIFSDGFRDQFGGPHGKKFMKKNFQAMFVENQGLSMSEQQSLFEKTLIDWMNFSPSKDDQIGQVDDILVMGIRF
jgi:ligand-binding sensor domain-containing protein/serine phosphatase RsbU (regulator of sigma subunit)